MTLIRIREWLGGIGEANAKLGFDRGEEYPITISDPFSGEQEQELEWYFERHLYSPFTDRIRARDAANSISFYGETLFKQVFSDPDAYIRYKECLNAGLDKVQIEIIGSPAFHRWHWEALKDPALPQALALHTTIVRKHTNPLTAHAPVRPLPTINLLLVIARPSDKRDVGYRTISRPVVESLRRANLSVKIDILRPGTYRALVTHLREMTAHYGVGYYHIIHFDVHGALYTYEIFKLVQKMDQERYGRDDLAPFVGKKAFLSFEGMKGGTADLVEASELADLLRAHQVPIVILNACQSGKQVGASEASLGSRLMQSGIQLVLAMGYSITVSAAEILMGTLYRELFAGHELPVAIRQARQELTNRKGRRVAFNQEIDLEDWLLPVVYQNQPLHIYPRPFTPEEVEEFSQRRDHQYRPSEPLYGFIGRDLDILHIEHLLLTKGNILLVRGMGGAGKTMLLRHLGVWWQSSGFVDQVCYFGYDEHAWTRQQLIFAIAKQICGEEAYLRDYQSLSLDAQQARLTAYLRTYRHLLLLDNLESITGTHLSIQHTLPPEEQTALRSLLANLSGGKTLVLLGSRSSEDWLAEGTFGDNLYELPGLDPEAASTLADCILKEHNATKYRNDNELRDLIKLLDGFPLALEVVLSNLARQTPAEVIAVLQSGDVNFNIGTSQEKSENILYCIEYSHSNLAPQAQQLFLCLAPFTSVLNMNWLNLYSTFLKRQPLLTALPFENWSEVVSEAEHWGLLKKDEKFSNYFHLQPVLPYFLRTRLHEQDRAEMRRAIETAFREAYEQIGGTLLSLSSSPDPQKRKRGQILTALEYENLITALNFALVDHVTVVNFYAALSTYLDMTEDHQRGLALGQEVLKRLEAYPPKQLVGQIGIEIVEVLNSIADRQLLLRQYTEAEVACQKALSLLLQNKYYDADQIRRMSALIYHQLGRVMHEQRNWEEAERYYLEALRLKIEFGDRYLQASSYHQLGRLAEDLQKWGEAEKYYQEALQIKIEFQDRNGQLGSYYQLGILAHEQGEWEKAERNYREALRICIELGDHYWQARIYHQLGMLAQHQRQWEEAERNYREALQICIEFNDSYNQARMYHQLGVVSWEQGKLEEAEVYYREALQLKVESADRNWLANTYGQLGLLAWGQGQWDQAQKYSLLSLEIFVDMEDVYSIAAAIKNLGIMWKKNGDEVLLDAVVRILQRAHISGFPRSRDDVVELWSMIPDMR